MTCENCGLVGTQHPVLDDLRDEIIIIETCAHCGEETVIKVMDPSEYEAWEQEQAQQ